MAGHEVDSNNITAPAGATKPKPLRLFCRADQHKLASIDRGRGIGRRVDDDYSRKAVLTPTVSPPASDAIEETYEPFQHDGLGVNRYELWTGKRSYCT